MRERMAAEPIAHANAATTLVQPSKPVCIRRGARHVSVHIRRAVIPPYRATLPQRDLGSVDGRPHDVFVFYSTALPSVILGEADSWQVDVLDFVDGVPGVLESSQALYMKTCHAADRQFPHDAETLGYTSIPEKREDLKISLAVEIFDHVAA